MFGFVARRVLQMIPVLLAIATITFFMIRLAPGGPFDAEKNVSPEIRNDFTVSRLQGNALTLLPQIV